MDTIDARTKHVTLGISIPKATTLQTTTWVAAPAGQYMLSEVAILFALGHATLTGVRLRYNGAAILPWAQPTQFINGDNERLHFPVGIYLQAPILVDTRNTDRIAHAVWLTASFVPLDAANGIAPYTPPEISV